MRPCVCVRIRTRLQRWGWETNLSLWGGRVSTEDIPGAWWGRLEKRGRTPDRRGPTSFRRRETTDKPHYKALTERCGDAAASAGQSLALAPWGLQRVRRRFPVFFRDHKDTPTRGDGRAAWHGSSAPTGIDRDGSPGCFGGEGPCVCEEQTQGDGTPDSSVGLLAEDHLDDGRAREGEETDSPQGAISLGSPGARHSHAGTYGEWTPWRQRGGAGMTCPLPTGCCHC